MSTQNADTKQNIANKDKTDSKWIVDNGKLSAFFIWIRFFLLFAGLVFLLVGFFRNDINAVFAKAVRICLECIGIG